MYSVVNECHIDDVQRTTFTCQSTDNQLSTTVRAKNFGCSDVLHETHTPNTTTRVDNINDAHLRCIVGSENIKSQATHNTCTVHTDLAAKCQQCLLRGSSCLTTNRLFVHVPTCPGCGCPGNGRRPLGCCCCCCCCCSVVSF